MKFRNPQDDVDKNIEVDIYPETLKVVQIHSSSDSKEIKELNDFLNTKLQEQCEAFWASKNTQGGNEYDQKGVGIFQYLLHRA